MWGFGREFDRARDEQRHATLSSFENRFRRRRSVESAEGACAVPGMHAELLKVSPQPLMAGLVKA